MNLDNGKKPPPHQGCCQYQHVHVPGLPGSVVVKPYSGRIKIEGSEHGLEPPRLPAAAEPEKDNGQTVESITAPDKQRDKLDVYFMFGEALKQFYMQSFSTYRAASLVVMHYLKDLLSVRALHRW